MVSGGAPELIELDIEPIVDFGVQGVVLVADLSRSKTLLSCFSFSSGAIFVCTADVQRIVILTSAVSVRGVGVLHYSYEKKIVMN